MCSPQIDMKVIPIQERIRKCKIKFSESNKDCQRCDYYRFCRRIYFEKKASKIKPIQMKGKRKGGR